MTPRAPVKVMIVVGTRPEAIKMAPVAGELARHQEDMASFVCATGQHRELLDRALDVLGLRVDRDLNVMRPDQTLAALTGRLFDHLDPVIREQRPDWLLVQGDTTSAMVGALSAFYRHVRVGHVEAGLRTHDVHQPFPEEMNRRIADQCADLCFAPTERARVNLLGEGVPAERVHVTGNTIVDAVLGMARRSCDLAGGPLASVPRAGRWVLVTTHRRESFGAPLERICVAVQRIAEAFPDIHVIVPVHPNPRVAETVTRMLTAQNCWVLPPLDYVEVVHALRQASLVLTDSGGIQEEAPTFGVPVLVLRSATERPEGIATGVARVVGTDPDVIVEEASRILTTAGARLPVGNPYGDGFAARRIVALLRQAAGLPRTSEPDPA